MYGRKTGTYYLQPRLHGLHVQRQGALGVVVLIFIQRLIEEELQPLDAAAGVILRAAHLPAEVALDSCQKCKRKMLGNQLTELSTFSSFTVAELHLQISKAAFVVGELLCHVGGGGSFGTVVITSIAFDCGKVAF